LSWQIYKYDKYKQLVVFKYLTFAWIVNLFYISFTIFLCFLQIVSITTSDPEVQPSIVLFQLTDNPIYNGIRFVLDSIFIILLFSITIKNNENFKLFSWFNEYVWKRKASKYIFLSSYILLVLSNISYSNGYFISLLLRLPITLFFIYGILSLAFYYRSREKQFNKYLLFAGTIIYSIIQLLTIFQAVHNETHQMFYYFGFVFGLFSKGIIVFGLYRLLTGITKKSQEELPQAFRDFYESINDDKATSIILLNLVNKTREILNADIVLLYRFEKRDNDFFQVDVTYSGELFVPRLADLFKTVKIEDSRLSKYILNQGNLYFPNYNTYKQWDLDSNEVYYSKDFKEEFWYREKIHTMAGIRLSSKSKDPIGILYVNFRHKITIDPTLEQNIETFGLWAAGAFRNLILVNDELKLAKEKAEAASNAKSAILANISHEILTPLTPMRTNIEYLKEITHEKEQVNCLNILDKKYQELSASLNNILEQAKIESKTITISQTKTDIRELIQESIATYIQEFEKKRLACTHYIDPNVPVYMKLDGNRIKQILGNLLNNAIKFTDDGSINVTVFAKKNKGMKVNLKISVKDTGMGIEEGDRKKIFVSFERSGKLDPQKHPGTGLGLGICKELAKLMNGDIRHETNMPKGSTFILELKDVEVLTQSNALPQKPLTIVNTSGLKTKFEYQIHSFEFDLTKVLSIFENELIIDLQEIRKFRPKEKVFSFSEKVIDVGKQYTIPSVITYGTDLIEATKSYEFTKQKELLDIFPDFISQIKKHK
ncbi:MAG: HAMP domain-containing sensor histidine kinase, partial [Melioribacteraceae bacterium]